MAFTINEKIVTELSYEEICLITVAVGEYKRLYETTTDKSILKTMERLVNRLGIEMYNHPDNNKPNGH